MGNYTLLTVMGLGLVVSGIIIVIGYFMSAVFDLQKRVSALEEEVAKLKDRPVRAVFVGEGKDAG